MHLTPEQAEAEAARILADALRPCRWWTVALLSAPLVLPLALLAGLLHGLACGWALAGAMAEALVNNVALRVYLRERQAMHVWRTWRGLRR